MSVRVTFLLPTTGRVSIIGTLQSLISQTYKDWDLIVYGAVDYGVVSKMFKVMEDLGHKVVLINDSTVLQYARLLNMVKEAKTDWVCPVDDDFMLSSEYLYSILKYKDMYSNTIKLGTFRGFLLECGHSLKSIEEQISYYSTFDDIITTPYDKIKFNDIFVDSWMPGGCGVVCSKQAVLSIDYPINAVMRGDMLIGTRMSKLGYFHLLAPIIAGYHYVESDGVRSVFCEKIREDTKEDDMFLKEVSEYNEFLQANKINKDFLLK